MKRLPWAVLPLLLLLAACKGGGEGGSQQKGAGKKLEYPVETEEVKGRRVEYTVYAVGSLEAFEEVYVIARVPGIVRDVLFKEGDVIAFKRNEKGDITERPILVKLDDERFINAANTAKAELDKMTAQKTEAEAALDRRLKANATAKDKPPIYSEEDIKSFTTKVAIAVAEADSARSRHDKAMLDLADTEIRAPVEGIIQSRTIKTNQQVQAGTVVATLVRRDPLLLRFAVPEGDATRTKTADVAKFTLRDSVTEYEAKIIFVNAQADSRTRMVEMIAQVQGDTKALKPGAFAQIKIPVGANENAPSVPQTAVRPSDRGFLAFVVQNGVAKERVLKLGLRTEDGRVEVLDGIKIGEKVVVRGAEALRDGAQVKEGGGAPKDGSGAMSGEKKKEK
ncbi:MAG: efflux RND transporter periplasmic adaptor subunit [Planctomycetes bacterium]|nr:efflux RND transporter periplasmic adaptor subunit [Planctomycetota bacterium]